MNDVWFHVVVADILSTCVDEWLLVLVRNFIYSMILEYSARSLRFDRRICIQTYMCGYEVYKSVCLWD